MRKVLFSVTVLIISLSSCGLFKETVRVNDAVAEKTKIDAAVNPAEKFLIRRELSEKYIQLSNVLVKDVSQSANIDYDFVVIAEVMTKKGPVECHIYSKNVVGIAKLKKGRSRIDAVGKFGRFFTTLDKYYTKIEIIQAAIKVAEPVKKKKKTKKTKKAKTTKE